MASISGTGNPACLWAHTSRKGRRVLASAASASSPPLPLPPLLTLLRTAVGGAVYAFALPLVCPSDPAARWSGISTFAVVLVLDPSGRVSVVRTDTLIDADAMVLADPSGLSCLFQ